MLVVAGVVGATAATSAAMPRLPDRGVAGADREGRPRARCKLTVYATGELRAGRTMTLVAPPAGGMLRIVKMVPTGTPVKEGDVVIEFDPADQQFTLEQAKSELAEAEQEIVKMKADAAVQAAQDEVALLTARYDVRRAELDAAANELIGAIEAQKNVLTLEEARRARWSSWSRTSSRARRRPAGVARGRAREAQQGEARDAARAVDHRQPRGQGAASTAWSRSRKTATRAG